MNYYEILGIKRTASQDEIKTAYKKLVKKYHPDIYTGDKEYAQKMTSQINVAYDVLSIPEERAKYDEETFPTYTYTPPSASTSYSSTKSTNGPASAYRNPYSTSSYGASRGYNSSNNRTYDGYNSYRYGAYTSNYNNTRDGSEHDYSSYAKYENVHQSNYKHSHTPYTNFQDKIFSEHELLENFNKLRVISVVLIVYVLMMVVFIYQYNRQVKLSAEKRRTSNSYSVSTTNTYRRDNTRNTTKSTSTPSAYASSTLRRKYPNCFEYYDEDELRQIYSEFVANYQYDITYEDFLSFFEEYLSTKGEF